MKDLACASGVLPGSVLLLLVILSALTACTERPTSDELATALAAVSDPATGPVTAVALRGDDLVAMCRRGATAELPHAGLHLGDQVGRLDAVRRLVDVCLRLEPPGAVASGVGGVGPASADAGALDDDALPTDRERAMKLVGEANRALIDGEVDRARALFEASVKEDASYPDARLLLANVLLQKQDKGEACRLGKEYIKLKSQNPDEVLPADRRNLLLKRLCGEVRPGAE